MSYVRLKTINSKNYEYFNNANLFAKRYRVLIENKIKIVDIQTIVENFCHSQDENGITELLKQGEPLSDGYIIIQDINGCAPYYHTGNGYTRDIVRAKMFSELETNSILENNIKSLKKERILRQVEI
jgi:hypothetical protein